MIDRRFASQVVAPDEEPRFFDDMGCLVELSRKQTALAAAAVSMSPTIGPAHGFPPCTRSTPASRRFRADGLAHRRARVRSRRARATRRPPAAGRWSSATSSRGACREHGDEEPHQTEIDSSGCARGWSSCSRPDSRWIADVRRRIRGARLLVASSGYMLTGGTGVQDFSRTAASLLQLVLLMVPLTSVLFGVIALTPEVGAAEMLYSQPVQRREILAGKLAGLWLALAASEPLGSA